jgi:putative methyltransferase (TIGR04325 family)
VRVLDFGGFDGSYRHVVAAAYPDVMWEWTVVELPEAVQQVEHLAQVGLRFICDLEEALRGGPDIVFASASINYVESPRLLLTKFLDSSGCTILTRVPLWPISKDEVAIQIQHRKSPEISYPTWFFSATDFLEFACESSSIALRFTVPEDRASYAGHYEMYQGLVLIPTSQTA